MTNALKYIKQLAEINQRQNQIVEMMEYCEYKGKFTVRKDEEGDYTILESHIKDIPKPEKPKMVWTINPKQLHRNWKTYLDNYDDYIHDWREWSEHAKAKNFQETAASLWQQLEYEHTLNLADWRRINKLREQAMGLTD